MSEKVARIARKEANLAAMKASQILAPDIQVAIENEYLTRERVQNLERRVLVLEL